MSEIEFKSQIEQIEATLQKDKALLGTTLSRIFDAEAKIQKLKADLKEKRSAKMADWESPQFATARLSICAASRQPQPLAG